MQFNILLNNISWIGNMITKHMLFFKGISKESKEIRRKSDEYIFTLFIIDLLIKKI